MTTSLMASSIVGVPDNACEMEGRLAAYSPAASTHSQHSQYSTYSREVKYIFNPVSSNSNSNNNSSGGGSGRNDNDYDDGDYADYSHIVSQGGKPQSSPHFLAHTPRSRSHTPNGKSQSLTPTCHNNNNNNNNKITTPCNLSILSLGSSSLRSGGGAGGENVLMMSPRDDFHRSHSRTSSVLSTQSRDRGPISPASVDAMSAYSGQRSLSFQGSSHRGSNHEVPVLREKNHFSPIRETPPPTYQHARNYSSFKGYTGTAYGAGYNNNNNWPNSSSSSSGSATATGVKAGQEAAPPRRHHEKPGEPHFASRQPPYPPPPRYTRRKTWSPPILKLNSQDARVCLSNDSLDHTTGTAAGRTAQHRSYSDDLDPTPPRLAPVSGVLAQKPGPNLVRPIAFKPIHATSPSQGGSRHPSISEQGGPSPDLARPLAMKLGTGVLGHRTSPDKTIFPPRPQHHQVHKQTTQGPDAPGSHHGANFRSPNANSSYHNNTSANNSQLNMSANSHHNISSASSHHSALTTPHHPSSSSYLNSSIGSHHNSSAASSHMSCTEDSFSADMPRPSDRADSVPIIAAASHRGWHPTAEGILQTPSPSDSGVGELEAILREKDAEINTLREVMDRNERAILQVYEERKSAWAQDAHEQRDEYERKLKIQSRKSYKTEQVLSLQVYKLQQEHKSIIEEKEKISIERDGLKKELEGAKLEMTNGKSQLESKKQEEEEELGYEPIPEEVALKNKEIISLRSRLHSLQVEMDKKNKDIADKVRELTSKKEEVGKLKSEVGRLQNPAERKEASSQTHAVSEISNTENVKPSIMGERERTINGLQDELSELREGVVALKDEHDREREKWLDEKNKVVRYQKQLQLNYVQMQRKNTSLETEVQQLTLELENRDMKLIALNGEESVC